MSKEQKEIIRKFYKTEYWNEIRRNGNELIASEYATTTTIAYTAGRFPKMQIQTFYKIIHELRNEMWGI